MNALGGKQAADGSAEERPKIGGHWGQGEEKEVGGWRQGGRGLRTDPQRKEQNCGVLQRSGRQRAVNGEFRSTRRMGRAGRTPGVRTQTRFAGRTFFLLLIKPIYSPCAPCTI